MTSSSSFLSGDHANVSRISGIGRIEVKEEKEFKIQPDFIFMDEGAIERELSFLGQNTVDIKKIVNDITQKNLTNNQILQISREFAREFSEATIDVNSTILFTKYVKEHISNKKLRGLLLATLNNLSLISDNVAVFDEQDVELKGEQFILINNPSLKDLTTSKKIGRGKKQLPIIDEKIKKQNVIRIVKNINKEKFDIIKTNRGDIIHDPISHHNIGNIIILTSPKKFKEIIIPPNVKGQDILKLAHALVNEAGKLFDQDGNELINITRKSEQLAIIIRKILNVISSHKSGSQIRLLYVPENLSHGHFVGGFMSNIYNKSNINKHLVTQLKHHTGRTEKKNDHPLFGSGFLLNNINM